MADVRRDRALRPFDFSGASALVIGGAKGLGFVLAKGLLEHGARVVVTSRSSQRLSDAVTALSTEYGADIEGVELDAKDAASVAKAVETVAGVLGGSLNIVVNAAGITTRDLPVSDLAPADWDAVMETNVRGAFLCAKAVLPLLKRADWARFVNITSMFATVAIPGISAYAASKGALLQLTRTLALEWAEFGITVNALAPGPFRTDMNRHVLEDDAFYERICTAVPLGRFAEPEELVSACLFLASRGSSFVTGASIAVDGGWTAR